MTKATLKKLLFLLICIGAMLSGCRGENKTSWVVTPTFTKAHLTYYGTNEKFGIIKVNGDSEEATFPVNQGRHYQLFFLDRSQDFNGKTYRMMATHEKSNKAIKLYESAIKDNQSGAKFVLKKAGLWKIDISVDKKPFTSFIIRAK